MNYAVIWTKKAIDQLAQAWIDAADRTAVQRASNRIDSMLAMQPRAHGESRRGNIACCTNHLWRSTTALTIPTARFSSFPSSWSSAIAERLAEWKRRKREEGGE
jgi:hypothetical protein